MLAVPYDVDSTNTVACREKMVLCADIGNGHFLHEVLMPLQPGQMLAHYRLVRKIGEGGMGVVWKGIDTSLERDVAIKILPSEFATDPGRRARFQREAKLLASINHPNIAAIYGLHESNGVNFLAMELLSGRDMAHRLQDGPLPLAEALETAGKICDALEAAHDNGIVHRDLKPANIHLGFDEQDRVRVIKVLDFGLAKVPVASGFSSEEGHGNSAAKDRKPSDRDLSFSPTLTLMGTEAGTILGTAAYMSPEQARGKPVDHRTDIWAFGCVLFEMLTGKEAFPGETATDIIAGVINKEPDWSSLPSSLPSMVLRVLKRCLEKDLRRRIHHIADARLEITDAQDGEDGRESDSLDRHSFGSRWVERGLWTLMLVVILAFALVKTPWLSSTQIPTRAGLPLEFTISHPTGQTGRPVVSPDGRYIIYPQLYPGRTGLRLHSLEDNESRMLPGITEIAREPFWSPDSRTIAYFTLEGKLMTADLEGAPPETRAQALPGWTTGTWGKNGEILLEVTENMEKEGWYLLRPGESEPVKIREFDYDRNITPDKTWPHFLPDGRHILFIEAQGGSGMLRITSLDDDTTLNLVPADSRAQFVPARTGGSGHLVFTRRGNIMAIPFDPITLQVSGKPTLLAEGAFVFNATGHSSFSVSAQGTLVYLPHAAAFHTAWVDRSGKEVSPALGRGYFLNPRISPDGHRVAMRVIDPRTGDSDIWIRDLERDVPFQVTSNQRSEMNPVWSPDGSRLAFAADWSGPPNLYLQPLDGTAAEILLPANRQVQEPQDWSPDGRSLVFFWAQTRSKSLWTIDPDGGANDKLPEPRELFHSQQKQSTARVSPDGRWMAYVQSRSGPPAVFIRPFDRPGPELRVSRSSGIYPRWSADGSELFFKELGSSPFYSVSIHAGEGPDPRLTLGPPQPLFAVGEQMVTGFEVHPDGKRFLLMTTTWEESFPPFQVMVNWPRLLKP